MNDLAGGPDTARYMPERRAFIDGERLRVEAHRIPGGGGSKYEPQTAPEARQFLLPLLDAAIEQTNSLPLPLRSASRLYVETTLLPNYLEVSHSPDALWEWIGAVPVGSRIVSGEYRTKNKREQRPTRCVVLAVSNDGLPAFRELMNSTERDRSERSAFREIRKLSHVGLPEVDNVLLVDLDAAEDDESEIAWEAVLHPSVSSTGRPAPIEPNTLAKWYDLVESRSGRVFRDYERTVQALTFVPVVIAAREVEHLAQFNPLRAMRPMPTMRPMPQVGMRSGSPIAAPPSAAQPSTTPRVGVFDGGLQSDSSSCSYFGFNEISLTPVSPTTDGLQHGCAVTGAVLYGIVTGSTPLVRLPIPVDSLRIHPPPNEHPATDMYWALDQIVQEVRHRDYNIVNLS